MHLSLLQLDAGGALVDARVDDDIWCNARVPVSDLTANERAWLAKVARTAISALAGDVGAGAVKLTSDGAHHVVYVEDREVARVDDGGGAEARTALASFVEAVQGVLLFGDDTRGLNKRARGDSPA